MSLRKAKVKCSRCGSSSELNVVTVRYDSECEAGRLLVYCDVCCTDFTRQIGVSIPLEKITTEMFLNFYRTGKTSSDPLTTSEIVFGHINRELINEVEQILHKKDDSETK